MGNPAPQEKTAIILFNLGGPDGPDAVYPFLFNLFSDKAIIGLPSPFRKLLARRIAMRRTPVAKDIYRRMGGGSTILAQTMAQAEALERRLAPHGSFRVFVSMRYWHPMSAEVAAKVKAFQPDRVVLLPLYPQYSTATTASSLADWREAAAREGIMARTHALCCYPENALFISAHARLIGEACRLAAEHGKPRILFSAHGLPKRVIRKGDPYQWQVERTVERIVSLLAEEKPDYRVCYQSKVGRLEWIGPSAIEEIERAGKDRAPVVIVPVAFVSEHSETLVELDIAYRELAERSGVPFYARVPTLGVDNQFIEALADLCLRALEREGIGDEDGKRHCPGEFKRCACRLCLMQAA